ncbi:MAG: zinc dependent phospholipase C family protein [Terriglobia bacterium]
MIVASAIGTLPEPLRADFQQRRFYLVEHAIDPDLLADRDPAERPHHFADVEACDSFPFRRFRTEFVIERRAPSARELRNGDAMWQIETFTLRLAADFRDRNWSAASHDAVFAAHYAADLTQPLHTTLNYDGQLSGQKGIHRRFETGVVEFFEDQWALQPSPAAVIPNLRARIFDELLASYRARTAVFDADREARAKFRYDDPRFLPAFARLAGPLAKGRIEDAASFTGSLWYTAWVKAGKPDLRAWATP